MARRRGPVPFPQAQVLAGRAFEAAKMLGLPVEVTLDQFQGAYVKTSRRRVARWNNPEYLRWRAEMLEGDDEGAPPVSGVGVPAGPSAPVPPPSPLNRLPPLRAAESATPSTLTDEQIEAAIADFQTARRAWSTAWADAIQERLSFHGVEVVESSEGIRWKRQGSSTPDPFEGFNLDPKFFK